jgi:hypothetical protein
MCWDVVMTINVHPTTFKFTLGGGYIFVAICFPIPVDNNGWIAYL